MNTFSKNQFKKIQIQLTILPKKYISIIILIIARDFTKPIKIHP